MQVFKIGTSELHSIINSMQIATVFLKNSVMPYNLPLLVFTDKDPQFESEFVTTHCLFLGLKKLSTTAYHRQTNEQFVRYSTIREAHCFIMHQKPKGSKIRLSSHLRTFTIPRGGEGKRSLVNVSLLRMPPSAATFVHRPGTL